MIIGKEDANLPKPEPVSYEELNIRPDQKVVWGDIAVLTDHDNRIVQGDPAGPLSVYNVGNTLMVSWVDKGHGDNPAGPMAFSFNFVDNHVDQGPTAIASSDVTTMSNLFYNKYEQLGYVTAYGTVEGGGTSIVNLQTESEWKWYDLPVELPSGAGVTTHVVSSKSNIYLIGVDADSQYVTFTAFYPLSREYEYLGGLSMDGFDPSCYPFSVIAYLNSSGDEQLLFVYQNTGNDNVFCSMTLAVNDLSSPENMMEAKQKSSAPPSLLMKEDGNVLVVYTGTNNELYSLTYDIENNEWLDSEELLDSINMHSDFNPAATYLGLGLLSVIYIGSDNNFYWVRQEMEYSDPSETIGTTSDNGSNGDDNDS